MVSRGMFFASIFLPAFSKVVILSLTVLESLAAFGVAEDGAGVEKGWHDGRRDRAEHPP
jgi:hypothetical protein